MNPDLSWWIAGGVVLAVVIVIVKTRTSGEDFTRSQYPGTIDKQAAPAPLRGPSTKPSNMSSNSPNQSTATSLSSTDLAVLQKLVQRGHLIEAMKYFRQKTGLGLKEAKDVITRLAGK